MSQQGQSPAAPRGDARSEWLDLAACQGMHVGLFFAPAVELPSQRRAREVAAKAVCAVCPVRAACLEDAMQRRERYGIWGGLSSLERKAVRRRRGTPRREN